MQEVKDAFRRSLIQEAQDLLADLEDLTIYDFLTMQVNELLSLIDSLRLRRVGRQLNDLRVLGWPKCFNRDQTKSGGAVALSQSSRKPKY